MSSLPRVGGRTRERIAREFDDRGPAVCRTEIILDLQANNPELLDIATRCAADIGSFDEIMTGFCMFYRVLTVEARLADAGAASGTLLPRVSPATRVGIVQQIAATGSQRFTDDVITELERNNPDLLTMWHNFAEDQTDYLGVMQGFALLYACLSEEAAQARGALH